MISVQSDASRNRSAAVRALPLHVSRSRTPRHWIPPLALACGLLLSPALVAAGALVNENAIEHSASGPRSLETLMAYFAKSGGVRVRFTETRKLSILIEPIETTGFLYFSPPDRLARLTTHPGNSKVIVNGSTVVVTDANGRREMNLGSSDIARGLIDNMMVVLRGDLPELRDRYQASYSPDGCGWVLELVPRSKALRAVIERVRVSGEGAFLDRIETFEANGDVTVARYSDLETGLDFDSGEWENIFSTDPTDQHHSIDPSQ